MKDFILKMQEEKSKMSKNKKMQGKKETNSANSGQTNNADN